MFGRKTGTSDKGWNLVTLRLRRAWPPKCRAAECEAAPGDRGVGTAPLQVQGCVHGACSGTATFSSGLGSHKGPCWGKGQTRDLESQAVLGAEGQWSDPGPWEERDAAVPGGLALHWFPCAQLSRGLQVALLSRVLFAQTPWQIWARGEGGPRGWEGPVCRHPAPQGGS